MPLFGLLLSPLAVAMSRSSPWMARALGYQSVGMNPRASWGNGKSDSRLGQGRSVKHGDRIQRGIRYKQPCAVGGSGQGAGISPSVLLPGKIGGGKMEHFSRRRVDGCHRIGVRQSDVEPLLVGAKQEVGGVRPGSNGVFRFEQRDPAGYVPFSRSSSATREEFHRVHQARRPSRVAATV